MFKVIFVVHGMRTGEINKELKSFISRTFDWISEEYVVAFLESNTENLEQTMSSLIAKGDKHFYVIPIILFEARHYLEDIHGVIETYKNRHNEIEIYISKPIGTHHEMIQQLKFKIDKYKEEDMAIVLLAHGSSTYKYPDIALKNICNQIQEHIYPLTIYGDLTYKTHLQKLTKYHDKLLIVPYFMFDGFLVNKTKQNIKMMNLNTEIIYTPAINFDIGMERAVIDNLNSLKVLTNV